MAQVCSSSFPQDLIPSLKHLYFCNDQYPQLLWQDDIESSQWLELLHPFTAVRDLYLSREFVPRIARGLQELVVENVTEVLPALQSLYLEELPPSVPVRKAILQFVEARKLSSHPIAVYRWKGKTKS